jgi:hypothetical protein
MLSQGLVIICLRQVNIDEAYGLEITISGVIAGEKLELCGQSSASESGFLNLMSVMGMVSCLATVG